MDDPVTPSLLHVPVTRLDPGLPLPSYAHPGDAGADLCAAEAVVLGPGERFTMPTGVSIALPDGYAAFVVPRSGLAMRHGKELTWSQVLMAANTPMLLKAGLVEGNTEAGVLASGQVAGILEDLPSCAELIESIVSDAIKHLQAASGLIS